MIDIRFAIGVLIGVCIFIAIIQMLMERHRRRKTYGVMEIKKTENGEKYIHLMSPIAPEDIVKESVITFTVVDKTEE